MWCGKDTLPYSSKLFKFYIWLAKDGFVVEKSYNFDFIAQRNVYPISDKSIYVCLFVCQPHATPSVAPWTLKRGGLETMRS